MSEEIWKDIPDYEGLYEASSHGRVRSKEGKITYRTDSNGEEYEVVWSSRVLKEKKVTSRNTRRNDKRVDLWKDKKPKTFYVARLIAMTFLPNPDNLSDVNHINGDYRDNRVENIEWVSRKENMRHAFKNRLIDTGKINKLIRVDTKEVFTFDSLSESSRFLGRDTGYVSQRLKRKYETAVDVDGHEYEIIISD